MYVPNFEREYGANEQCTFEIKNSKTDLAEYDLHNTNFL